MVGDVCTQVQVNYIKFLYNIVIYFCSFVLSLDDMTYGTFVAQLGYRHQVCAADMVHCVSALLDSQVRGRRVSK